MRVEAHDLPVAVPRKQQVSVYPNPFNSATRISYDLGKFAHVRLTVYDITGRQVETLTDEMRTAGTHEVRFDGSGMASGVYFVKLQAGEVSRVEKVMLLR